MAVEQVIKALRTFFASLNKVVRWFVWGAIAIVGTIVALLAAVPLIAWWLEPEPRKAEELRGIRSVEVSVGVSEIAQQCGIRKDEVVLATQAILRQSLPVRESNADATIIVLIYGHATTDRCVLAVDWRLTTEVLAKRDRRRISAAVAYNGTMLNFPRQDAPRGKSLVQETVEQDMRRLAGRWSEVNPGSRKVMR